MDSKRNWWWRFRPEISTGFGGWLFIIIFSSLKDTDITIKLLSLPLIIVFSIVSGWVVKKIFKLDDWLGKNTK